MRNITVVGNNATLQMRRADYAVPSWGSCPSCRPYKKSEWRAGIMIAQSDDLRISGLNIVESGGDGFYIHCAPGCRNLHISDCVADSNYRQGMVGEQSSLTRLAYAVAWRGPLLPTVRLRRRQPARGACGLLEHERHSSAGVKK